MKFNQLIRDYLTFSRNERKGIIVLLVLIFMFTVANRVLFYFEAPGRLGLVLLDSISPKLGSVNDSINRQATKSRLFSFNPNTIDSIALDSLDLPQSVRINVLKFRAKGGRFYSDVDFLKIYGVTEPIFFRIKPYLFFECNDKIGDDSSSKSELFVFDPNIATDKDFKRLGLSAKQILTIRNYQSKGGKYKNKESFLRMWGLSEKQKSDLTEFIVINKLENDLSSKEFEKAKDIIELNSADSILLKQLPGIGDKFSRRIVKYRDLLGGFHSLNQLKEVYGLSEQTIMLIENKVKIDASKIRKIDLNFANVDELSKHPYLKNKLSRQIVAFRTKYGRIHDLSVLCDSMILNTEEYNKIKPYY